MEREQQVNGRREKTVIPSYVPMNQASSFTVEKALSERLETLRDALVLEAEKHDWDTDAVDKVLTAGGLPPMTREYVVQYTESVDREVRVRAKDSQHASQLAALDGPGFRLVGVKEVPE